MYNMKRAHASVIRHHLWSREEKQYEYIGDVSECTPLYVDFAHQNIKYSCIRVG
jgi:hypothetical protein